MTKADSPLHSGTKLSEFTVPINDRYFEDYVPGAVYEYGTTP